MNPDPINSPVNINITLGDMQGAQNLIKVCYSLEKSQEEVIKFVKENDLQAKMGEQFSIVFDFYMEQGREKDGVAYFEEQMQGDEDETSKPWAFSPLQYLFAERPQKQDNTKKYVVEEHIGFVRVYYWMLVKPQSSDIKQLTKNLDALQATGFNPQAKIVYQLKGSVSHKNNNRTNVKIDYAHLNIHSDHFSAQKLFCDQIVEFTGLKLPSFSQNIFRSLKQVKMNIKTQSFRKMKKYFLQLTHADQKQTKAFKYKNNGLFRQKVNATLLYKNQYIMKLKGNYESQDVFIRLIKIYLSFFNALIPHDDD